ncbi:carboxypeptidase-like regulatory domain-containing protein [Hymenobacter lapidiphilus]|uniref:PD40 domain-containing protein n=1 Tax=Hymenobacter lapidiphilus TaxID=2608003 RepID=A0A7Y7U542_9BACT|nr:carboxypeptidase-like regulatory domain-containing protein [Hymenobacter lapidiphilus]NVO30314.1 PD40 domain-containing protein [Hymenobacter lapidiphilus]
MFLSIRSRTLWLLLVISTLWLTSCEDNPVEPVLFGKVTGTVRDARNNQPLANASITSTPATSSIVTDAQGNFELTGVPTGRLTIVATKVDYRSVTVAVTVENEAAVAVAIVLEKNLSTTPPSPPVRPAPADQATVPGPDVKLEWHPAAGVSRGDSLRYDVVLYQGTSGAARNLLTNSPDTTVVAKQLNYNTTYFWQVTVRNAGGSSARSALWSFRTGAQPDNRYLFARTENGNTDIYSSNETGTTLTRLTASPFVEANPRLSPNRDRIAYTSNATGQFQLYTMNRDGSDVRQVTLQPVDGYFNQGIGYCWSPDGGQLVYSSFNKLYRINRDGTGLVLLATAPAERHFREVDWTGQGNRVVVQTVGVSIYDSEFYLLNADGSNFTQLIGNVPGRLDSPSFSVEGQRIIYTRDVDAFNDGAGRQLNAHIFTQNLDGSGLIDVSAGSGGTANSTKPAGFNDIFPRYSPDGARIIFVQVNNVTQSVPDIFTVDLNGRNRVKLFDNATMPDWK